MSDKDYEGKGSWVRTYQLGETQHDWTAAKGKLAD